MFSGQRWQLGDGTDEIPAWSRVSMLWISPRERYERFNSQSLLTTEVGIDAELQEPEKMRHLKYKSPLEWRYDAMLLHTDGKVFSSIDPGLSV